MKAVPTSRYAWYAVIAVAGCAVDLATKSWMFNWLGPPDGRIWWLWKDRVGFQLSLNQGALFGMGQGMVALFAVLSIVAALGIFYWLFFLGAARDRLLTIALSTVTAGILGNLYDRLGWHGLRQAHGEAVYAVRDWILVMIGTWPWPTFNIADSLLVCGAAALIWHSFREGRQGETVAEAARL